ncbi:MAG: FAD-dependent oxidoreductase [Rhizobiales bacterium]|nr:FAD-dependent oxidoreductase [Hyphomicrobiales bacterium]
MLPRDARGGNRASSTAARHFRHDISASDRRDHAAVNASKPRRALVIGGSMSGLFAAILLRRAGWDADIYERVDVGLIGRGAGIVTHAELRTVLRAAGCDPSEDFGVEITMRRTLDRTGVLAGELVCPQTSTSWDRVFRMLREQCPDERYHIGKELQCIDDAGDRVVAHFADGTSAEGDLLVGADGFRSNVRADVLPAVKPVYAGYVGWRGLVDEDALPAPVHADVFEAMVFGLPPNEQFICYPVAGRDNDLRPGHRRCNFVWYRPAEESSELRQLLTDASGRFHALGIPPPLVRTEVIASLREASRTLLAPQLDAVVRLAPLPFLQPIFDVETPHMVVGRVAIVGDAAFLARPHVAAGVTKAAEDAMALANALRVHDDVAAALAAFQRERLPVNRRIMQRGRELGGYLQPHLLSPVALAAAERHHGPETVMSEIAVLDFLKDGRLSG